MVVVAVVAVVVTQNANIAKLLRVLPQCILHSAAVDCLSRCFFSPTPFAVWLASVRAAKNSGEMTEMT